MIINFRDLGSSGGGSDPRLTTSAFTSVDYVASAKTIYFKNLDGSVVDSIDATDFVIDGMVEDVYISGNTLVIEFNTESGKQDINVDLSTIFDPDNYWTSAQTQSAIENAVSGKADADTFTAYTPTSGFATINGSAITEGGDIVIQGGSGATYSAGANIDISAQNEISVTGITSYTGITSGDITTALGYTPISGVDLTDYWTSAQTNSAITAATDDMATQTWVGQQNYLTGFTESDPVFTGSPAYGITSQDINDWNSKLDAGALTPYYTSAQTQSAITEAISTIDLSAAVASANTYTDGEVSALTAHLEDVEQVTASALTSLHTDIIDLSGATAHMVESEDDSVVNVIKISQADYDALVAQSATSITTLYVIIS